MDPGDVLGPGLRPGDRASSPTEPRGLGVLRGPGEAPGQTPHSTFPTPGVPVLATSFPESLKSGQNRLMGLSIKVEWAITWLVIGAIGTLACALIQNWWLALFGLVVVALGVGALIEAIRAPDDG